MPTVCIDFDATIAYYDGWKGHGVFGKPLPECRKMLGKLKKLGWIIIVNTCRSETELIIKYLDGNKIPYDYINYNPENTKLGLSLAKPIADVYVDDRAVKFEGDWTKTFRDILQHKRWYEKE